MYFSASLFFLLLKNNLFIKKNFVIEKKKNAKGNQLSYSLKVKHKHVFAIND